MNGTNETDLPARPREGPLHVLRVETSRAAADVVEEALEMTGHAPVRWDESDRDLVRFEIFFDHIEAAEDLRAQFQTPLETTAGTDRCTLSIERLEPQDWKEAWKRHFRTQRISERIVVKPTWARCEASPGDCVITLDPGMSFGTGLHPTTRACLRFLDRMSRNGRQGSLLDAGCGSGILSIAAAKLGFAPVVAFDHDATSVRICGQNLQQNGVEHVVRCCTADMTCPPFARAFSVVAANLLADILTANAERLAGLVSNEPGSTLLLAGILSEQYPRVREIFETLSFVERESATEAEWTSGRLERK